MTLLIQIVEESPLPADIEAAWLRDLPASRRAELAGWPEVSARWRSLLASRLLREGLRQFGFPAGSLSGLRYSARGKPRLDLPLDFSLSHCVGRILCALSTDGPVGVDVEPIDELTAAEFTNYLSAAERRWAGDSPRRFFALWTRKEAVVKAAGTRGVSAMREVRIERDHATYAGTRWQTAAIPVDRGFSAHVAQARPYLPSPDVRRLTLRELIAA